MTPAAAHDLGRRFFAALSAGDLPDALVTDDMAAWTTSSGALDKSRYQGGVRLLASLFPAGYAYTVETLTAEDDRVAAEVRSAGVLADGREFANRYVFVLRLRDGRVAAVAEHFDPCPVRETIVPLVVAAMTARAG